MNGSLGLLDMILVFLKFIVSLAVLLCSFRSSSVLFRTQSLHEYNVE
jgi:hypothetical protein